MTAVLTVLALVWLLILILPAVRARRRERDLQARQGKVAFAGERRPRSRSGAARRMLDWLGGPPGSSGSGGFGGFGGFGGCEGGGGDGSGCGSGGGC